MCYGQAKPHRRRRALSEFIPAHAFGVAAKKLFQSWDVCVEANTFFTVPSRNPRFFEVLRDPR